MMHVTVPTWQFSMQAASRLQAQEPERQTLYVPQAAPSLVGVVVGWQAQVLVADEYLTTSLTQLVAEVQSRGVFGLIAAAVSSQSVLEQFSRLEPEGALQASVQVALGAQNVSPS